MSNGDFAEPPGLTPKQHNPHLSVQPNLTLRQRAKAGHSNIRRRSGWNRQSGGCRKTGGKR